VRTGWLLAYAPFLLLLALLIPRMWPEDGLGDTFRFWYAGHIVATGGSPYDQNLWASAGATFGDLAKEIATACAPSPYAPICLWPYPPTTALLFAPFGALGIREGLNALAAFFVVIAAGSVVVAGRWINARSPVTLVLALCAGVTSHAFIFDVHAGHFEGLGVIGIVLLAVGLARRRLAPVIAGALLLGLKPHLYIGVAVVVLVLLITRRDWRTLGWTAAMVVAVNGVALLLYPEALGAILGRVGQVTDLGWSTTWAFATGLFPSAIVGVVIVYAIAAFAFAAAISLAPTQRRVDVLISAGAAIGLTVPPYLHPYDLLVLLPAFALALALAEQVRQPWRGILLVTIAATFAVGTWVAVLASGIVIALPGVFPVVALAMLAVAAWAAREAAASVRP
jgi:hypothetical protein